MIEARFRTNATIGDLCANLIGQVDAAPDESEWQAFCPAHIITTTDPELKRLATELEGRGLNVSYELDGSLPLATEPVSGLAVAAQFLADAITGMEDDPVLIARVKRKVS